MEMLKNQIAVKVAGPDSLKNEMTLIEFQGEFEHSDLGEGAVNAVGSGLDLGELEQKSGGNYELRINNQLLHGKSNDQFSGNSQS